jgi:predicted dinucleotide-binding enzyme
VRFGIFGTGVVGKTMATRLAGLEHEVMVGTRNPEETVSRTEPDAYGHPPFSAWQEEHPEVRLGTFSEAAAHGEMVKTLHTMNAYLMVDPAQLAGADHTMFVSGNDSEATDTDLGRHHYRAGYRDSAPPLVAALRCATEARLQLQDRRLIRDCVLTEQYLPTA